MTKLNALTTAAMMALILPLAAPTASFAQTHSGLRAAAGAPSAGSRAGGALGPGAGRTGGGAAGPHFAAGQANFNRGAGNFERGGDRERFRGSFASGDRDRNRGFGDRERFRDRDRGGGFGGFLAGAAIGGALASNSYAYYGGPGYGYGYGPSYDQDDYYGGGTVAVVPVPVGGNSVAYCEQKFRSYDPASGTYLGYDGVRHACP